MAKKGEFEVKMKALDLGLEIDRLSDSLQKQLKDDVKNLAHAAYAKIVAEAQAKLQSTGQDYLKNLKFEQVGSDGYIIYLDGGVDYLEDGYSSFDMKPGILKSNSKVSKGSRAGQPWVRESKDGHKYAVVPFEHQPFSKAPQGANMADAVKKLTAKNSRGRKQKITSIFKGKDGKPLEGKVAVARSDDPLYDQLTKYQKVITTKTGKQKVQSTYVTYRIVSELQSGKWIHPGFEGLGAFAQLEKYVDEQLTKILQSYK